MREEFVLTKTFWKHWKALGLTDEDLRYLENFLHEEPFAGDIIQGVNGLRKLRVALPGRGKSGGARVCYLELLDYGRIYLYRIYSKNEQVNLSKQERNELSKEIEKLKYYLRNGGRSYE